MKVDKFFKARMKGFNLSRLMRRKTSIILTMIMMKL